MSYLEIFKRTGAATNRRTARKNPYELLVELRAGDPTASWDRLFSTWAAAVEADDDHLNAVLRYAWTNFTAQYDRDNAKPRKASTKSVAAERAAVAKITGAVKQIVLMDMLLPSGRRLRDATFKECSLAGGWFKVLATKGKPSQKVGEVLTEEQLRSIK